MPAPLLFLRLLSPDQAEWLRSDGTVERGPPSELVVRIDGARLILVAPGEAVTLHWISLPARKRTTWARVVPYALEDQLVDDIEALHFALGNALDDGRLPVAVVAHAALRAWLDSCGRAGLTPAAVVPDLLLLPWREGAWSVLLDGRRAVVRTGRWEGFATERDTLDLLLNQALAEAGDAKPRGLRVWGDSPPHLTEIDVELQVEDSQPEPLRLLAAGYQPPTALDLMQGPYSRRAQWGRWLRPWRAAAVLAGLWLLVHGAAQVYDHWRLRRELVTLRAEMEGVYRDAVPGATRIVNPRVQLETRLRELKPGASGGGFLQLLYRGGQPITGFPELTLRGLSYRDGQLDLALEGGNPAVLDRLRQQLNQQPGLQAEMRTTQREGQVESRVTLKKASS
ncbi:MAG: type II secretion system protein GspL [Candidatus Competibacter sp.]|nr:type II secretion system protein GspL [Candidatus Competibacter sp.]